jgi:hypothetical protein
MTLSALPSTADKLRNNDYPEKFELVHMKELIDGPSRIWYLLMCIILAVLDAQVVVGFESRARPNVVTENLTAYLGLTPLMLCDL